MNLLYIGAGSFIVGLAFFIYIQVFGKKANFYADLFAEREDGSVVIDRANVGILLIKKKGEIDKWKIIGSAIPPFQPKTNDFLYPYMKKKSDKCYLLRDRNGNIHACKL